MMSILRRSSTLRHPVVLMTAGMALLSLLFLTILWGVEAPPLAPFRLPWFVFAVAAFMVERYTVHLHFRGDSHTMTLGEVPMIVGLFLAAPVEFAVGRMIGGVVLLALHRQQPMKLAFNASLSLLEGLTAGLVWHAMGGTYSALSSMGMAAALLAMVVSQCLGSTFVWAAIGFVQERFRLQELWESLTVGIPFAAANTAAALSVMALLFTNPVLAWVPVIPFVVMLVAYRAYGSERRHRDTLAFLYEVSRAAHDGSALTTALESMLRSLREHLSASSVELYVGTGAGRMMAFRMGPDDELQAQPVAPEDLSELQMDHGLGRTLVPGHQMVARSHVGQHQLILQARSGVAGADGFDEVGLGLLESVANVVATVLERADLEEMKTAFLSAVSHELRTPLAVVMGTASTLRHRGPQLRQDQTELLTERLEAHAHRLDKLLTDLLDIDRLARGVVEPRRREVDVSLMASRLLDALEVTSHPIKLYGTGVRAAIDGPQVERIVENLVRNAVKYTPAGTPIEVSLQRLPDGVRLIVEDRGPGVPDIAKTSILEPFVRLDADHPSPGTGIGLSLVRRFAQLHGGDIEVKDRPGGGATFSVTLLDDRPDLLEPATVADHVPAGGSVVALRAPA